MGVLSASPLLLQNRCDKITTFTPPLTAFPIHFRRGMTFLNPKLTWLHINQSPITARREEE